MANKLIIEIAYALPEEQILISLACQPGTTVQQAIEQSGLLERFPTLLSHTVGIWSKPCPLSQPLKSNDRIEIYRPLTMSPMEARQKRAGKKNRKTSVN